MTIDTEAVTVDATDFTDTWQVPDGCHSFEIHPLDGDIYYSFKSSPATGTSGVIRQDVPKTFDERLLANKIIKFAKLSGNVDVRITYIAGPEAL